MQVKAENWNGMPKDPQFSGYHWLHPKGADQPHPMFWNAQTQKWKTEAPDLKTIEWSEYWEFAYQADYLGQAFAPGFERRPKRIMPPSTEEG